MKPQTIYRKTDVNDELPNKTGWYATFTEGQHFDEYERLWFEHSRKEWFCDGNACYDKAEPFTHWLKEENEMYVFSKQEFENLMQRNQTPTK